MYNKKLSDLIVRRFTKELEGSNKTVYDLFKWKKVDIEIKDFKTGEIIWKGNDLEFPENYSKNACDIVASKYFKKKGVPNSKSETSMKQVVHRMVNFWVLALENEKLISKKQKNILYDELVFAMLDQRWAPNSPQWFNTGLFHSYENKKKGEGFYYYDPEKNIVVESEYAYERTAGSACFILDIADTLLGEKSITDRITTETRLFKYGAGTGTNFSNIRGKGEGLSGGGTSSGLMSFLKIFDTNAGAIKSGGTTRRAAKIVSLDMDHPEIESFIDWKRKEEDKVRALGKMGYSLDFNGEAYATVSGQNSNNSVRPSDIFMKKALGLDPDPMFELKGRVDSSINRKINAKELWQKWNYAAWSCGDPAPQYHDIINQWHTCPYGEGLVGKMLEYIEASNPCSEYHFLNNTACNLLSINVARFYDINTQKFNIEDFIHMVTIGQLVLEATIHWGHYPTPEVAKRSYLFRTTGGGLANTGYLSMIMAFPYDSDESRNIIGSLAGILTGQSYLVSSLMAEKIGAFEKYEVNKKPMMKVIRNHARVAGALPKNYEELSYKPMEIDHNILNKEGFANISLKLKEIWKDTVELGDLHGFRNAQTTVIAPTGTISFAMDCATTSTEPVMSHIVYKKLVGGGNMEIINPAIPIALDKLGYNKQEIEDIENYVMQKELVNGYEVIKDGKIEGAPHLFEEHYAIFDTANKCGSGERFISPDGHVKMVAQLTPLISGAISKTVNLPNDATVEDFKYIHKLAWELGTKAVALYRDNSKASQPLNSSYLDYSNENLEDLTYDALLNIAKKLIEKSENIPTRKKPTPIRLSRTQEAKIEDIKIFTTIGFDEKTGDIIEVFLTADKEGSLIGGILDSISILISHSLQFGIPAEKIANALIGQKYEPHGFVEDHPYIKTVDSISDLIGKMIAIELGNYKYCQVKPEPKEFLTYKQIVKLLSGESVLFENKQEDMVSKKEHNISGGERMYGKICPNCNSKHMYKNGTCYVCSDCGSTTGCS